MTKRYSEDTQIKLRQMANDLAASSIVTDALGRHMYQVLEFMHEGYIHPLQQRVAELEHQVRVLGGKL